MVLRSTSHLIGPGDVAEQFHEGFAGRLLAPIPGRGDIMNVCHVVVGHGGDWSLGLVQGVGVGGGVVNGIILMSLMDHSSPFS